MQGPPDGAHNPVAVDKREDLIVLRPAAAIAPQPPMRGIRAGEVRGNEFEVPCVPFRVGAEDLAGRDHQLACFAEGAPLEFA